MATTTPNYSWPVPTSTDLVKDGATAIEALGDAIDATVFGLPVAGLTKISSTAFSAVTSVSVNNCFSATYQNYRVIITYSAASAGAQDSFRFRVGGADNSTANYTNSGFLVTTTPTTSTFGGAGLTSFSDFWFHSTSANESISMDILTPFAAERSKMTTLGFGSAGGPAPNARYGAGVFTATTSFDGFSLISSSGTITGTIKVYGYKD